MKVFNGIGIILGLFFAAGVIYFISSFVYVVGNEFCLAGRWLDKLDLRLNELEEKIKLNSHHIGHCHDSCRRMEDGLRELRAVVKKDSKEMAKGSVDKAAEQLLNPS